MVVKPTGCKGGILGIPGEAGKSNLLISPMVYILTICSLDVYMNGQVSTTHDFVFGTGYLFMRFDEANNKTTSKITGHKALRETTGQDGEMSQKVLHVKTSQ